MPSFKKQRELNDGPNILKIKQLMLLVLDIRSEFSCPKLNDIDVFDMRIQQDYPICHTAHEKISLVHKTFSSHLLPPFSY